MITVARDPVRQRISTFFMNMVVWGRSYRDINGNVDKERIFSDIQAYFQEADQTLGSVCSWFDNEFKAVLGVDIYEYPFDQERGFTIIRQDGVHILILKLESLARCFSEAMSQFLEIDGPIPLRNENITAEKERGPVYEYCLRRVHIPESTLEGHLRLKVCPVISVTPPTRCSPLCLKRNPIYRNRLKTL